ncbi:FAD:protein FMN transferase [Mangrovimicrobium sediminis]|uniref:FAD:protein FMN transferase n=2 Tax=Mangrovimicrobium sediminis TaxID=2562682 RepID=A0A4Z0M2U4_9GAMM|nr:FAD:protein FMN transferase [Haliea sp. SAOS-164]
MGTTWHATVVGDAGQSLDGEAMQAGIAAALEAVNAAMSTYREDSEISRFNRGTTGQWVAVSDDFQQVLEAALAVGEGSEGAYDVTVGPLVNLWGFGPAPHTDEPPSPQRIEEVRQRVGQDKLELDVAGGRLRKHADIYLDFSSIAKGFAVDKVVAWLESQGVHDYLVEVGGEMRLGGLSPRGDAWRVAIEQPDSEHFGVARAIKPGDAGVATSGDYRNFFEVDGVRYSHSIDPRSGYPVAHELVSVTVVHSNCMLADAWATALTVLGPEAAWSVAQAQGLAVYFIQRDGEGFASRYTDAFAPYLVTDPQ